MTSLTARRLSAVSLSFFVFLSACSASKSRLKNAAVKGDEIVDAEGMAPYNAQDIPGSRAAALAAAQRQAVELVVGVYVNAKTRVDKAVAIQNNIMANVQGYVKKYQILSEGKSGDYYKVRIRALVSTDKLREDLDSLGALKAPGVGNPRVGFLMQEWVGEKESKSGDATRALTQALINKGFQVVALPVSVPTDADPIDIARSLNRNKVELIINGLGRAQSLGYGKEFGGMHSYRASVSFRVIEVGSGQVLTTVSETASGLEATPELAASKSLAKAAELAGNDLGNLPEDLAKRSLVTMKVTGLTSFEKLSELQKSLITIPGVKDLYLRSFNQTSGEANLEMHLDGISPQEVANDSVKIGGTGWSIYQVEGPTIQLSASPAGR
jgi:hypothetical protein